MKRPNPLFSFDTKTGGSLLAGAAMAALLLLPSLSYGEEYKPSSCRRMESAKKARDTYDSITQKLLAETSDPEKKKKLQEERDVGRRINLETYFSAEQQCTSDNADYARKKSVCEKKNSGRSEAVWKWNDATGECEDTVAEKTKTNPNSGDCSNAELFKGDLKGQHCKKAENTIRDVKAQQESLTATTQIAATTYSSMQAMQATGQQADAQARQQKILQTLAIAKIATGGLQLAGAAQLKNSAGDAEAASSSISQAHKDIAEACNSRVGPNYTSEQCFYQEARQRGVAADAQSYATFERMKSAASQSQEQADKANQMAKVSMITGMADTLVGLQALQLSRQAQQNAVGMGLPPRAPPPSFRLGGTSAGGLAPGAIPGEAPAGEDFVLPGSGPGTLGVQGGRIGNGIKAGKGFGGSAYRPGKSTVSTTGGGSAGSLRGGGGGSSGASRGGGPTNTTAGEYNMGGGGAAGFRGGPAPEKADGTNPFAEALAKLFPQDQNGKPVVVDGRSLASGEEEAYDNEAYIGSSEVYASDLSIFEQINAKYRQLANTGRL